MTRKETWVSIPLKPELELEFYLRLARLVEAPTRPQEVTALLDCLAVPTVADLAAQRPLETALVRTKVGMQALWDQLNEMREQAEGYGQVAGASVEQFSDSLFGQVCTWCTVELNYLDAVEVELSEFALLLSSTRMMLRLPFISEGSTSEQVLSMDILQAHIASYLTEQLKVEQAAAGIATPAAEDPLALQAYIRQDGRYRPIPVAQLPRASTDAVLLLDPAKQTTTLYQQNPEGTTTTYWSAEQHLAHVSDDGVVDLGDTARYQTLILAYAPQRTGPIITEQMLGFWAFTKRRVSLLLRSQDNKVAQVDWQHWHARVLLDCLEQYEPALTKHVRYVTTGYALAAMGLIESEDDYLDSDRKSSYREYLRTKVQALDARP